MYSLLAKLFKTLLLPAIAQGPCEIRYVETKSFAVCEVRYEKHKLSLVLEDETGKPYATLARVQKAYPDAIVLGNAGMFHPSLAPVGLFVQQGKTRSKLNLSAGEGNFFMKPNGVFWMDRQGFHVDESQAFGRRRPKAQLATQSGPMLLIKGKRHPAFRKGSKHQKIRNGVGVSEDGQRAYFVISMVPVSFWELSTLFQDKLGVQDALYLDGVVSSIWAPGLQRRGASRLGPIFVVR